MEKYGKPKINENWKSEKPLVENLLVNKKEMFFDSWKVF